MEVRTATEADIKRLAQMGCESFPTGYNFEERLQLFRAHPRRKLEDDILVGEVDGEIVVTLSAIPYQIWLGGTRMPMLGIAGVSNALEARRRGYASELCIAAIRSGRERGFPVSILYPFRYNFYRKLGWGAIGELIEYNFHPASLPRYAAREQVRRFRSEDMLQVIACYQRYVERGNCLAERPLQVWQEWQAEVSERKLIVMVYERDSRIEGYLECEFDAGNQLFAQVLIVNEMVYDNHNSYQGLLGFLGTLSDQITTIRYWARPEEAFHHVLSDPRDQRQAMLAGLVSRAGQYGISYMLRILDVEKALMARANYYHLSGTVTLQVIDEQVTENDNVFQFSLEKGQPMVKVMPSDTDADVELRIDLLSQLYAGGISAERAYFLGLFQHADPLAVDWLQQVFRLPRPFLLDQF